MSPPASSPGPVELSVQAEIGSAEARPGLAQLALAMARLLDNPRAVNQQPSAAKVLTSLLGSCTRPGQLPAAGISRWSAR
jgi:hypothetical protein